MLKAQKVRSLNESVELVFLALKPLAPLDRLSLLVRLLEIGCDHVATRLETEWYGSPCKPLNEDDAN